MHAAVAAVVVDIRTLHARPRIGEYYIPFGLEHVRTCVSNASACPRILL